VSLLNGFTILDFSHRLPGPMGMNVLGHLGAKVYKIEDEKFKDAFLSGLFNEFDPSFIDWYEGLNEYKDLLRLDFKSEQSIPKLHELVKNADGIMMALPPKVRTFLKLTDEDLKQLNPNIAVIEMGASKKYKQSMHDLNAMALTGMLSLHTQNRDERIIDPPFLPVSGIFFGQQLATDLLAAILKAKKNNEFVKTTSYLYETAELLCKPIWSQKMRDEKRVRFLHNGAYPCYSLYRTSDGHYVGLAAVEEKFYIAFQETFNVTLEKERRFETTEEAFNLIAQKINSLTKDQVAKMIKGKDMCVSIVEKV
jgi:alpha-methylacyl-CoA racemase